MQFSSLLVTFFAATTLALPASDEATAILARVVNAGRPVATGACCIANTSKKTDVCAKADGTSGVCAVANTAGCEIY